MSATRSSWAICCSSWFPHDMWQPKCWDIKIDSIFEAVLGDLATIQQWCYNGGISKFSLPSWILWLGVPNSCFCVGSSTMSASALQIGLFASYQAIPRAVKLVKETPKGVGESPLETPKRGWPSSRWSDGCYYVFFVVFLRLCCSSDKICEAMFVLDEMKPITL